MVASPRGSSGEGGIGPSGRPHPPHTPRDRDDAAEAEEPPIAPGRGTGTGRVRSRAAVGKGGSISVIIIIVRFLVIAMVSTFTCFPPDELDPVARLERRLQIPHTPMADQIQSQLHAARCHVWAVGIEKPQSPPLVLLF
jgi:hypothetical protein